MAPIPPTPDFSEDPGISQVLEAQFWDPLTWPLYPLPLTSSEDPRIRRGPEPWCLGGRPGTALWGGLGRDLGLSGALGSPGRFWVGGLEAQFWDPLKWPLYPLPLQRIPELDGAQGLGALGRAWGGTWASPTPDFSEDPGISQVLEAQFWDPLTWPLYPLRLTF